MNLFKSPNLDINGIKSNLTIGELIFAACHERWPYSLNKKTEKAQLFVVSNYLENICESDASTIDGIKRNPQKENNLNVKEPSFLAIVTGGEIEYTRKDGVKILPIGCL